MSAAVSKSIREPAVAGQFYPGDPAGLGSTVAVLLDQVAGTDAPPPKALILPHAGYVYSGPVAATGYARLKPYRDRYERVILMGPCHRVPLRGIGLSSATAFRTPLGDVPLDHDATAAIESADVCVFDETHLFEHSLEVHLPFLQLLLGSFTLVPMVVGATPTKRVAEVLEQLWGGPETLIVISTDLSHYHGYEEAQRLDASTCRAIERLDAAAVGHERACGATPLGGLLIAAKRRGLEIETVDLRNSGDTSGDRGQVVGYGAWVLTE